MEFYEVLDQVIDLLRSRGRVTYRALKRQFDLDDAFLEDLKEEIIYAQQVAVDEDSRVLVWTGETEPKSEAASTPPAQQEVPKQDQLTHGEPPPTEPPTPDAERRQLTVMFCDLVDSTKLSQQLDPEDLREVVRAYQATAAEVLEQYEGHMAQYLGDGLLIYFGWPVAHEDDAQRAAHAGLGIVEAIATTLNPRLEHEKGVQLAVRIGIHTGPVVVGEMGGGERHENLATGETVNIASRLEGLAAPNAVAVSSVTEQLVRGTFALENLGPQVLKGIAEPMQVFRVMRPLDTDRDNEQSQPERGFLVGRDEERGLLLRRWEQSKEGLGQVVLISGEAGIGKSFLVATVGGHVLEEGYTRITFRCSPYHINSALSPVITHLEQMLGFERDDTSGTKLGKLEQVLRTTNLALEESVPLVATLLSVPMEDRYPAPTQSPQQQRQQTLDTLVAWLMEASEKHPVLAVWEDLHWADPSTLEMLGLVLEQTPTVPMLHVLTFRPEFSPPWPTRSHMTPITLNRLDRLQVEALVRHLADGKRLPAEVVEHIVTKTDGVPLFVEELTKMFLESSLLQEEADHYTLTGPLAAVPIPVTLQDSLMARLDRLKMAKEIAQLGAVLGRVFSYDVLQALAMVDESPLQEGLAQLVEAELLYQRGRPPRARYIFKHALIQDAAYQTLLKSTRQQYHRRIVETLESRFPQTVQSDPELLAHHCTEAGLVERAIDYWYEAGTRAGQRSAYVEAARHLHTGLTLIPSLPDGTPRIQRELDLHLALGVIVIATRGHSDPEVARIYNRARELCQQVGEPPELIQTLHGLQRFFLVSGNIRTAYDIGVQMVALGQRIADATMLIDIYGRQGHVFFHQGNFTSARQHLEQSLALYDRQQHAVYVARSGNDPGVSALIRLAITLWFLGYPDQAMQKGEEALRLARDLSHPFALIWVLCFMTWLYHYQGDIASIQACADAAFALATEHCIKLRVADSTIMQGWVMSMQGHHEIGLARIQQGVEHWKALGAGLDRPYHHGLLAEAFNQAGQYGQALESVAEGLDITARQDERFWEAELLRLRGLYAATMSSHRTRQAEADFKTAFSIARSQHAKSLELRAATSLARLWQSQDKRQDAYDLLAPVYGWFTEGFDTADLKDAKALLAELQG